VTTKPLYTPADFEREGPDSTGSTEPYRTPWRIDHARLVHCPAFRRLQGKTQLFPGESDFFRNRLTHSIEVAQIAKSIAIKINHQSFSGVTDSNFRISEDLVEFAALAHDLGHPPFGHNGEAALDECMSEHGGFEGNAQTLRILSRIEKKRTQNWPSQIEFVDGRDMRRGLNLTMRSLASVLKYDRLIASRPPGASLKKGYYSREAELVRSIKRKVAGDPEHSDFKTIECEIMDVADDIAYSTYDFEDAMKAGFTSLLDLLAISRKKDLLRRVAIKVWKRIENRSDEFIDGEVPAEILPAIELLEVEIVRMLYKLCKGLLPSDNEITLPRSGVSRDRDILLVGYSYQSAMDISRNGYLRTSLTSQLVGEFIRGVGFDLNEEKPTLSRLIISKDVKKKIEVLKHYTYEAHIEAARLKAVEFRGKEIVREIFECLKREKRNQLLPQDWKARCEAVKDENHRLRTITDFIAGMTDRYALEFYDRLKSSNPSTIFKEF
jgi:dGTPase